MHQNPVNSRQLSESIIILLIIFGKELDHNATCESWDIIAELLGALKERKGTTFMNKT